MKKRRIRKLVKRILTATAADGTQLSESDAANLALQLKGVGEGPLAAGNLSEVQFLARLLDVDNDTVANLTDVFPDDAREQVDTDLDEIGDNRDIILSKIALDAIFQDVDRGQAMPGALMGGAVGTLIDLLTLAEACHAFLQTQYPKVDPDNDGVFDDAVAGDAGNAASAANALASLSLEQVQQVNGVDITIPVGTLSVDGMTTLSADITAQLASALALKAEIAAATPTVGVTIDDIDGEGDYDVVSGSSFAVADAAATGTGVAPSTVDIETVAPAATALIAADIDVMGGMVGDNGSIAMINGIINGQIPPAP